MNAMDTNMNATCGKVQELLTAYHLQELPPAQAEQVRQHLAECAACRATGDEIKATLDLLQEGFAAVPATVPLRLDENHRQQVFQNRLKKPARILPFYFKMAAIFTGALAVTALAIFIYTRNSAPSQRSVMHSFSKRYLYETPMTASKSQPPQVSGPASVSSLSATEDLQVADASGSMASTFSNTQASFAENDIAPDENIDGISLTLGAGDNDLRDTRSEEEMNGAATRVPVLGDVPVMGRLYDGGESRLAAAAGDKVELTVAATPAPESSMEQAEPEGESRRRARVHEVAHDDDGVVDFASDSDHLKMPGPAAKEVLGRSVVPAKPMAPVSGIAARELDKYAEATATMPAATTAPPPMGMGLPGMPGMAGSAEAPADRESGERQYGFAYADKGKKGNAEKPAEPSSSQLQYAEVTPEAAKNSGWTVETWRTDGTEVAGQSVGQEASARTLTAAAKLARKADEKTMLKIREGGQASMDENLRVKSAVTAGTVTAGIPADVGKAVSLRGVTVNGSVSGITADVITSPPPAPAAAMPGTAIVLSDALIPAANDIGQPLMPAQSPAGPAPGAPIFDSSDGSVTSATSVTSVSSVSSPATPPPAAKPMPAPGLMPPAKLATVPAPVEEAKDRPAVFKPAGVNPWVSTEQNRFSTFSIDVDTASYTVSRNYLNRGFLPPPEAVRVEEFVNFFDYTYPPPEKGTFAVYGEYARNPFRPDTELLKIGVKGMRFGREKKQTAVLTFVLDTSGSMNTPDRLDLAKQALKLLVERLAPGDRVALVAFDSHARLIQEHVPAGAKPRILAAIDSLQTSGSTHLEEGLTLAYEVAARGFRGGAANQVILLSDGVANLGSGAAAEILKKVEKYRQQGIYCSVFGLGLGNYDDTMLVTLADKGNGAYHFLDSLAEARRVFVDDLAATLNLIAGDVKIQVEFNSRRVLRFRQIGYEKRQLKTADFRNDAVDAGEVGSGQSVTALYDLQLQGDEREPLATVRVRYRNLATGLIEEIERPLTREQALPRFDQADPRFRLAAGVAEFAELLRGSPYAAGSSFADVAKLLRPVALELSLDQRVQELLRLVQAAGGGLSHAAE